ncbi:MAG: type VI secretion system contractile sheath large subunit [Phycisphaerales bacterium]|nr:type VI secretion system contractile sheath large subunit [Phycisphaerales bacterium]
MSQSFNFGFLNVPPGARRIDPEDPFKILVVADFSGRDSRGERSDSATLAGLTPLRVEVDTLEDAMARMDVRLKIDLDGSPIEFHASSLDDFHPDSLYRKIDLFRRLKDLRTQLANPSTYPEAAREVRGWLGLDQHTSASAPAASTAPATPGPDAASDIERLMGRPMSAPQAGVQDAVSRLIKATIGPTAPSTPPDQAALIAAIDRATSTEMRRLLHHPSFKELEAAWRAVHFLLTRLETDETLGVWIVDVARMEAAIDLLSQEDPSRSGLHRLLADKPTSTPGLTPWSLIVLPEVFRARAADAGVLARWAGIAQAGGAALLAGASEHLFACPSLPKHADPADWTHALDEEAASLWGALREFPASHHVALGTPRVLLRRPYGPDSDPIDLFEFTEIEPSQYLDPERHNDYLWASSSFVLAVLLGRAFRHEGWSFAAGHGGEVDGMAYHSWRDTGVGVALPAAEAWLTTRAGDAIEKAGLCPILSVRGRDAVQVARVQSLAGTPLAGPWSAGA